MSLASPSLARCPRPGALDRLLVAGAAHVLELVDDVQDHPLLGAWQMEALARYGARRLVLKYIQRLPVNDRWSPYLIQEVPRLDAENAGERDQFFGLIPCNVTEVVKVPQVKRKLIQALTRLRQGNSSLSSGTTWT